MQFFDHDHPELPPVAERRYPQSSDASMRLSMSFVKFGETPIWLQQVVNDTLIEAMTIDGLNSGFLDFNDERIDVANIPVGWVNTVSSYPVHLVRIPHRAQKQGFGPQEAAQFVPFQDPEQPGTHVGFSRSFAAKGLSIYTIGQTLLGNFLLINDLVNQPCGGPMSSEWCISAPKLQDKKKNKIFTLFHDSYSIGYYDHLNRRFCFRPGTLTKTRRRTLNEICIVNGGGYVIEELLD